MQNNKKYHIRSLFIAHHLFKKRARFNYEIVILTDDFKYIEYSFIQIKKYISSHIADRLQELFFPYILDKNTDIVMQDTVEEDSALNLYITLINRYTHCNVYRGVSMDHMFRRIAHVDQINILTQNKKHEKKCGVFITVWKNLIKNKRCIWITESIDKKLDEFTVDIARRERYNRTAAYYMLQKIRTRRYNMISNEKRRKMLEENSKIEDVNDKNDVAAVSQTINDDKENFYNITI